MPPSSPSVRFRGSLEVSCFFGHKPVPFPVRFLHQSVNWMCLRCRCWPVEMRDPDGGDISRSESPEESGDNEDARDGEEEREAQECAA